MTTEERIAELEREQAALRAENAALRAEVEKLRKALEEWKRGFRERSKRRTSRREGKREASGKRPGRAKGHPGSRRAEPERIDGEVEHAVPAHCDCGGKVEPTGEATRTVVQDVPPVRVQNVRHVAWEGRCQQCGRVARAPLPGAVASGTSIAQVQLGPTLQAMAVGLRFEQHVPLGQIGAFFGQWFGVSVTAGGLSQLFDRLRMQSGPSLVEIVDRVRTSAVVGLDETGLRQNGIGGWVWLVRTDHASLFRMELSRGAWVAEALLGQGFVGVVCSDFYAAYTRHDDWTHGYCGAHLIREAKKIAELHPCPETAKFSDQVQAFYAAGHEAQAAGDRFARASARGRLTRLIRSVDYAQVPDVVRLQIRLGKHKEGISTFLDRPDVPATNNATERDLRSVARHRAMTGGTRSEQGSHTFAHWMSITQTLRKNDLPLRQFVLDLYDAHLYGTAPPSVFASASA